MDQTDKLAYGEMSLVIMLWGASWPVGRIVAISNLGHLPFSAAFIRYFIALPFLLIFTKFAKGSIKINRKLIKPLIGFGILQISLYNFFFLTSLRYTSSSDAVLILNASISIFTALLASRVYTDENLNRRKIIGLLLALTGAILVFFISPNTQVTNRWLGNVIILAAAVAWSLYTVYSRPIYEEISPITFQFWSTLFGWVILGLIAVIEYTLHPIDSIEVSTWWALIYLGILGAAVPNTLFSFAIKHIGPTRTTILINTVPLVGIFTSILLLGEYFSIYYLVAFAIIFLGILLVNQKEVPVTVHSVDSNKG